jgi:hypothetical protein
MHINENLDIGASPNVRANGPCIHRGRAPHLSQPATKPLPAPPNTDDFRPLAVSPALSHDDEMMDGAPDLADFLGLVEALFHTDEPGRLVESAPHFYLSTLSVECFGAVPQVSQPAPSALSFQT